MAKLYSYRQCGRMARALLACLQSHCLHVKGSITPWHAPPHARHHPNAPARLGALVLLPLALVLAPPRLRGAPAPLLLRAQARAQALELEAPAPPLLRGPLAHPQLLGALPRQAQLLPHLGELARPQLLGALPYQAQLLGELARPPMGRTVHTSECEWMGGRLP